MKLYLIRHGDAVASTQDVERPLSETGVRQVTQVAQKLVQQGSSPVQLYHSGILRAEQTAAILQKILHIPTMEKLLHLQPEADVEPVLQQLATWTEDTMLVSHLPYLPQLLWSLVGGEEGSSILFQPATTVCLTHSESNRWQINQVVTP